MFKKNLQLMFALIVLAGFSSPAWALLAGFNIDVHMDIDPTGRTIANDFHIKGTVKSGEPDSGWANKPKLVMQINGGFPNFKISDFMPVDDPAEPGAQNTFVFEADWSGRDFVYCEVLHLGLLFDVVCHNTVIDIVGWWTFNGQPLQNGQNGGAVLIPGFDVRDRQSPQILQIRNDSGKDLGRGIGGHILQVDLLVLTAEQMQQMFGAPEELFSELRADSPLQQELPWVPAGGGQDFQVDSFFDVFVEIDIPGTGQVMRIEPGGFLIGRTLVEFPNNAGELERRWVWHFHEAHEEQLDWGDAPEITDNTGLTVGYPTKMWLNGANHVIRGPWLGPLDDAPDPEPDGQPDPAALGDDNDGNDDEDGVQIPVLVQGVNTTIMVEINGGGGAAPPWLDVWIDFNGDADWNDAGEQVFAGPLGQGLFPIGVTAPVGSVVGQTFARFRVSTVQGGLPPVGAAPDGEVEDHEVIIERGQPEPTLDFGDAPEDLIDPPSTWSGKYPTVLASNGARHVIKAGPWLGDLKDKPDAEKDGQPEAIALGDDNDGNDDENGVQIPSPLIAGQTYTLIFTVNNDNPSGTGGGTVSGWIDFNGDRQWDASEQVIAASFPVGTHSMNFAVPPGAVAGRTFARFRITSQGVLSPVGLADDGEVEDYLVVIERAPMPEWDFGDAPVLDDSIGGYPTLLMHNGARHMIIDGAPWLGPDDDAPDAEFDGQPTIPADGDDINGASPDDEDGVTIPVLLQGRPDKIVVEVNGPGGQLDAWIDWNQNSMWEPHELIFSGVVGPGMLPIPVTAPVGEPAGMTYARFRINRMMGPLPPDGPAEDGEVEDHVVNIRPGVVEVDVFPEIDGEIELLLPDGTIVTSPLGGEVSMHVYFEGQEGDADDDDGDGLDEVDTEIVSMNLTGGGGGGRIGPVHVRLRTDLPSPGVMTEVINATPGLLDVAPFAEPLPGDQFAVDSFFDVFTEISLDGGQSLLLPAVQAIRLAGRITHKPPIDCDEVYESTEPFELIDAVTGELTGIVVSRLVLRPVPCPEDWGDAPDDGKLHMYPTLKVNNGARHRIDPDVHLGDSIDPEGDGQPNMAASGDDMNGPSADDEDGIKFLTWPLVPGKVAKIEVTASVDGFLSGWVDFAADGGWAEASDQVFNGMAMIPAGTHVYTFNVPLNAKANALTYSRFRFATDPVPSYEGPAKNGEVEDYPVLIRQNPGVKWIQRPDQTNLGIDINVSRRTDVPNDPAVAPPVLADDFECTSLDRITDVHLWGSWKFDDVGKIRRIHLSIHSDDPVGPGGSNPDNNFSTPDELLWERDFFEGEFRMHLYADLKEPEWWWDPLKGELLYPGDHQIYQVDIKIDPREAFLQKGTPDEPIVYWLDVQVDTFEGEFGWKTRRYPKHWNDDAVMLVSGPDMLPTWRDLRYPPGHPLGDPATGDAPPSIDMAFVITSEDYCPRCADLNCDGIVNLADFAILLEQYLTDGDCY